MSEEKSIAPGTPKEIKPVISKLTEALMLIALLDLKRPTNKELSKYLGFRPSQTSMYLKKLEDYEYVNINRNALGNYDQRSIRIELTVLGQAQAWLSKASVHLVPGKDDIAIAMVKGLKRIMGKKGKKNFDMFDIVDDNEEETKLSEFKTEIKAFEEKENKTIKEIDFLMNKLAEEENFVESSGERNLIFSRLKKLKKNIINGDDGE